MNKYLLMILTVCLLSACGSEDGSEQDLSKGGNGLSLKDLDLASLKGPSTEPDLKEVELSNGQSLELNSTGAGMFEFYPTQTWVETQAYMFDPVSDGLVAVVVKSDGVKDLNLVVYENTDEKAIVSFEGENAETIVFNASSDKSYTIEVRDVQMDSASAFRLTITSANRSTLNLSENEYYVGFKMDVSDICASYLLESKTEYLGIIFNFKDGYLSDSSRFERTDFASTTGTTFNVVEAESNLTDGYVFSETYTFNLEPEAGRVTGSSQWESAYSDGEQDVTCESVITYTGDVLL